MSLKYNCNHYVKQQLKNNLNCALESTIELDASKHTHTFMWFFQTSSWTTSALYSTEWVFASTKGGGCSVIALYNEICTRKICIIRAERKKEREEKHDYQLEANEDSNDSNI